MTIMRRSPFKSALAAENDTASIPGYENKPLVVKVKIQKTLSLHLGDYLMNLRMQNGSTAPKDVLNEKTLDFPRHIQPYPSPRKRLVMTQLAARAGAVLHNIARTKSTYLKNVDFKFALDMRYNPVVPVRIPRFMLGTETGGATTPRRAGGVSSTALGGRRFTSIMRLLRYCPDE